jgi:hypothetical protein
LNELNEAYIYLVGGNFVLASSWAHLFSRFSRHFNPYYGKSIVLNNLIGSIAYLSTKIDSILPLHFKQERRRSSAQIRRTTLRQPTLATTNKTARKAAMINRTAALIVLLGTSVSADSADSISSRLQVHVRPV